MTGGKDIPYAAQRRLIKLGFLSRFLLFFTALLATSATRLQAAFRFQFWLWLTGVDA